MTLSEWSCIIPSKPHNCLQGAFRLKLSDRDAGNQELSCDPKPIWEIGWDHVPPIHQPTAKAKGATGTCRTR